MPCPAPAAALRPSSPDAATFPATCRNTRSPNQSTSQRPTSSCRIAWSPQIADLCCQQPPAAVFPSIPAARRATPAATQPRFQQNFAGFSLYSSAPQKHADHRLIAQLSSASCHSPPSFSDSSTKKPSITLEFHVNFTGRSSNGADLSIACLGSLVGFSAVSTASLLDPAACFAGPVQGSPDFSGPANSFSADLFPGSVHVCGSKCNQCRRRWSTAADRCA